ncbi:SusC/RagA family TonB-linked outer membrane protein [uncultured Bacteroides sp.]|uniref:SusC/RagA family TonB-linked outer membrane protein n=1 Tax=uncultured Bacteroides sp. TaxID=162156 RepID=UPI002AAACB6D|nr:SusC/RagA family TonB-linked outer membrane protein [uncultured Bacteroides sp.]
MEKQKTRKSKFRTTIKYKTMALLLMLFCAITTKASENKFITIQQNGISIINAFDLIKQQTGVSFMYQDNIINKNVRLNLNLQHVSLKKALETICQPVGLAFSFRDNYVLITENPKIKLGKDQVVAEFLEEKKQRSISGKITDESKSPLPGANVVIAGKRMGVISDNNGNFSLEAPSNERLTLNISYIGMEKQTVSIKAGNANIQLKDITMREDNAMIDELVVTGYQQIDRRNLTSSVTSVKMKDIMLPGVSSLDKMLEGRVPDMIVSNNSGEINSVPKIRIRGTSTLIGNREPLWVIDGVVVSDPINLSADVLNDPDYINRIGNAISGINPQDIERIDILKDAAATALYGTRAANGIIVVTTKKGRIGKPIVSYTFNSSYRRRPRYTDRKINLMNSKERVGLSRELFNEHYKYDSSISLIGYEEAVDKFYSGVYTESEFKAQVAALETQNTDWFKLLTHDSFSSDHSVNVSGGTDNLRYYASLGYTDNNDVINSNNQRRYTGATRLDLTLGKIQATLNLNVYNEDKKYNQEEVSPIDYAYKTSRVIPAYNADGSYYNYQKANGLQYMNFNILNELDNSYQKQKMSGITATLNLRYQANSWLNFNGVFSYSSLNTNIEGYSGDKTWYAAQIRKSEYGEEAPNDSKMPVGGELSEESMRSDNYTARLQANINKYFGSDKQHNFSLAIGTEAISNLYNGYSVTNRGYNLDRGKKFVASIPSKYESYYRWLAQNVPTITDNKTNLLAAYMTASYSYKNIFTINANTRYDGSNKFGSRSNEKLLPIWSTSGLVDLKALTKMHINWLDALTLKASYGEQGNMIDGQTPVMILQKGALDAYYNELVSTVSSFANPDLKWEKTHSYNTGIETSLLKNRLMFSIEYYYKKTTDAFMNKPISDINGYSSYIVNSGNLINQGYNISFTATPIRNKDFNWIFAGSFSKIMNKINTAPGKNVYDLDNFLNGTAVVKGQPVGTFYSYKFVGLNPVDGGPLFDDWEERSSELIGLSNYDTYTKVLVPSGKRDPDISGSISHTLNYKSWRLSMLLNYSLGAKVRRFKVFSQSIDGSSFNHDINPEYNVNRELINRWKKQGDERYTNIPAIMSKNSPGFYSYTSHYSSGYYYNGVKIAEDYWNMYDYADIRVVSADYLQIANVSLTYELPSKILNAYKLHRVALTLSGSNLYTFCAKALKGQTPNQSGFSTIQLSDTPTYTFGINIEF